MISLAKQIQKEKELKLKIELLCMRGIYTGQEIDILSSQLENIRTSILAWGTRANTTYRII